MHRKRFEKLWELMQAYDFKGEASTFNDIMCDKCKKIMVEPYSTECGCKYCKRCISDYLGRNRKKCPGNKDTCLDNLQMDDGVSKDNTTANIIARTIVKCPNEKCSFMKDLFSIEDHIRVCKMRPMPCPYQAIGCGDNSITDENINNHLQKDAFNHSNLLLAAINNLRNDINESGDVGHVNEEMNKLQEECNKMTRDLEYQKLQIIFLKEEDEKNKVEMNNQLREINKLRGEKERDKRCLDEYNIELNELTNEMKTLKTRGYEASVMMEDIEKRFVKELETMRKDIEYLKKSAGNQRETEELKKQLEKQSREIESLKSEVKKLFENSEKTNKIQNPMALNFIYDCVWTIEDLSTKKGEHFSKVFTSNQYKFCLRAWFGSGNLWLFVCLRKGERDGMVEWPMKHSVTVSIMNQESLRPYVSERYSVDTYEGDKEAFNRPDNDNDCRIGDMQISLSDIKSIPGLLSRGNLIVCCSLIPTAR